MRFSLQLGRLFLSLSIFSTAILAAGGDDKHKPQAQANSPAPPPSASSPPPPHQHSPSNPPPSPNRPPLYPRSRPYRSDSQPPQHHTPIPGGASSLASHSRETPVRRPAPEHSNEYDPYNFGHLPGPSRAHHAKVVQLEAANALGSSAHAGSASASSHVPLDFMPGRHKPIGPPKRKGVSQLGTPAPVGAEDWGRQHALREESAQLKPIRTRAGPDPFHEWAGERSSVLLGRGGGGSPKKERGEHPGTPAGSPVSSPRSGGGSPGIWQYFEKHGAGGSPSGSASSSSASRSPETSPGGTVLPQSPARQRSRASSAGSPFSRLATVMEEGGGEGGSPKRGVGHFHPV